MADLESMTPQERSVFQAAQRLFGNSETRLDALKLVKKADPTWRSPELTTHELLEEERAARRKSEEKMQIELMRERVERRRAEQRADWERRGLDPARLEQIVVDYGIAGDDKEDAFAKAERLYALEQRAADSSAAAVRSGAPPENLGATADWMKLDKAGLMKKSAEEAHAMIDQFRKGAPARARG
jgi:hypothetical protein